jgi:hypothetical protein
MRPLTKTSLLLSAVLLLTLGAAVYHKYSIAAAETALNKHLEATIIDFSCQNLDREDAVKKLHQELAQKDPFFLSCAFEIVDPRETDWGSVSLDLSDATGAECLLFTTELTSSVYHIRPQKVLIGGFHSIPDQRDRVERAVDVVIDWLRNGWRRTWEALRNRFDPWAPPDPFAL